MFSDGRLFFFFAAVFLFLGFTTDTTVSTSLGEVHNIGLMDKKQNYLMLAGFLMVAGVILKAKSSKTSEDDNENEQDGESLTEVFNQSVNKAKEDINASWSKYSHLKLRLQSASLLGLFTTLFLVGILLRPIEDTGDPIVIIILSFCLFTLIALGLSLISTDGVKASIGILKFLKYMSYLFAGLMALGLLLMWLVFGGTDVKESIIASFGILLIILLAFVPIFLSTRWIKKLQANTPE